MGSAANDMTRPWERTRHAGNVTLPTPRNASSRQIGASASVMAVWQRLAQNGLRSFRDRRVDPAASLRPA